MFLNYLKTTYRDLRKNKLYAFISIFGLAVGISVSIVLVTICLNMLNHDKFHEKGERIYQAFTKANYKELGTTISSIVPAPLGEDLVNEIPEIINSAVIRGYRPDYTFIIDKKKFQENCMYADPSLFSIFSFPILIQLTDSVFSGDNSIAISEKLAKKFYGNVNNAIGKTVTLKDSYQRRDVIISTIFKEIPDLSSLKFDAALPLWIIKQKDKYFYTYNSFLNTLFVEVTDGTNIKELNEKIKGFLATKARWTQSDLFLYKFENVYLADPATGKNRSEEIRIFIYIAIGILLLASINFINITISRTTNKVKEVALRKAVGANRGSIIVRFIGENFLITLVSLLLALFFAELLIPLVNSSYLNVEKFFIPYSNVYFYLSLFATVFIVSCFSGIYPSLFLSSFSPINIIKGNIFIKNNPLYIRKGLILIQFVISGLFLVFTFVSYKQINFIVNKGIGLRLDKVVEIKLTGNISNHLNAFKNELELNSNIKSFTTASFPPMAVGSRSSSFFWEGKPENLNDEFLYMHVYDSFFETFNIKFIEGRDFEKGDSNDINNVIINEEFAKVLGKENPVGTKITFWGETSEVIGVVKNFHHNNLLTKIEPLVIIKRPEYVNSGFIKYNSKNSLEALTYLKKVYEKFEPEYLFSNSFLEDDFKRQHLDIMITSKLNSLFAVIAVLISCLGLFGLTAFTTEQKRKEIGIRKVLGAPVSSILYLLSKGVIKLVITSFVLSIPVGYFLIKDYLKDFVYKIEIGWDVFLWSFFLLLAISITTVLIQAFKAANANPVDSLRSE